MRKVLLYVVAVLLLVVPLILKPTGADAAAIWRGSANDLTSSWWVSGGGYGAVSYDLSWREDHTYTTRLELTYHQSFATYYSAYPYSVVVQHSNRYYYNGNYVNGISFYQWGGAKEGVLVSGNYKSSGGGNYTFMTGAYNSFNDFKLESTSGVYARTDEGSVYGTSNKVSRYFP